MPVYHVRKPSDFPLGFLHPDAKIIYDKKEFRSMYHFVCSELVHYRKDELNEFVKDDTPIRMCEKTWDIISDYVKKSVRDYVAQCEFPLYRNIYVDPSFYNTYKEFGISREFVEKEINERLRIYSHKRNNYKDSKGFQIFEEKSLTTIFGLYYTFKEYIFTQLSILNGTMYQERLDHIHRDEYNSFEEILDATHKSDDSYVSGWYKRFFSAQQYIERVIDVIYEDGLTKLMYDIDGAGNIIRHIQHTNSYIQIHSNYKPHYLNFYIQQLLPRLISKQFKVSESMIDPNKRVINVDSNMLLLDSNESRRLSVEEYGLVYGRLDTIDNFAYNLRKLKGDKTSVNLFLHNILSMCSKDNKNLIVLPISDPLSKTKLPHVDEVLHYAVWNHTLSLLDTSTTIDNPWLQVEYVSLDDVLSAFDNIYVLLDDCRKDIDITYIKDMHTVACLLGLPEEIPLRDAPVDVHRTIKKFFGDIEFDVSVASKLVWTLYDESKRRMIIRSRVNFFSS